jgi:hypothetical protein
MRDQEIQGDLFQAKAMDEEAQREYGEGSDF